MHSLDQLGDTAVGRRSRPRSAGRSISRAASGMSTSVSPGSLPRNIARAPTSPRRWRSLGNQLRGRMAGAPIVPPKRAAAGVPGRRRQAATRRARCSCLIRHWSAGRTSAARAVAGSERIPAARLVDRPSRQCRLNVSPTGRSRSSAASLPAPDPSTTTDCRPVRDTATVAARVTSGRPWTRSKSLGPPYRRPAPAARTTVHRPEALLGRTREARQTRWPRAVIMFRSV